MPNKYVQFFKPDSVQCASVDSIISQHTLFPNNLFFIHPKIEATRQVPAGMVKSTLSLIEQRLGHLFSVVHACGPCKQGMFHDTQTVRQFSRGPMALASSLRSLPAFPHRLRLPAIRFAASPVLHCPLSRLADGFSRISSSGTGSAGLLRPAGIRLRERDHRTERSQRPLPAHSERRT